METNKVAEFETLKEPKIIAPRIQKVATKFVPKTIVMNIITTFGMKYMKERTVLLSICVLEAAKKYIMEK